MYTGARGIEGAVRIAGALVARPLRGRRTTWGATASEIAAHYPGDDLVLHPAWGYTHVVEVGAPPEQVWPWVVQIGQGRGGFYSYQGLENLVGCRIRNTRHIEPAFQSLAVGDEIRLHPRAPGLRVRICELNHSLVLVGGDDGAPAMSLWAFHLISTPGGRTRLIERGAYTYGPSMSERLGFGPCILEPISFVMSRTMLLTIADLAGPPVYRVQGWRSGANRVMSLALTAGVAPPQMVLLHTTGRTSGQVRTTPVYVTDHGSHRYLAAPYGAVGWVHNLRADPHLTLRRGTTTEPMRAEEVTDTVTAAAVLARYHASVKASRPYFQAAPGAGADELAAETHLHPVFTLHPQPPSPGVL